MADAMKISAKIIGDVLEIRVLVKHAMETGQAKDTAGRAIPAHFVKHLTVSVGERPVFDAQLGTAISRNPVFAFKVKGAKIGDKVVVSWTDNRGDRRTDEATVVAAAA